MAPLLEAALFYVQTASGDLLAARDELARLRAARAAAGKLPGGQASARLEAFIAARRAQGRGIPALPAKMARVRPDAPAAGGVSRHRTPSWSACCPAPGAAATCAGSLDRRRR